MQGQIGGKSIRIQAGQSEEQIELWLVKRVARLAECLVDDIDITHPLSYYGMDSIKAAWISGELEIWLGVKLSPLLMWDYPSIQLLANYLAAGAPDAQALAA